MMLSLRNLRNEQRIRPTDYLWHGAKHDSFLSMDHSPGDEGGQLDTFGMEPNWGSEKDHSSSLGRLCGAPGPRRGCAPRISEGGGIPLVPSKAMHLPRQ
jgi:hypothetical protein